MIDERNRNFYRAGTLIGYPVSSVSAKVAVPLGIVVLCLSLSRLFDVFKRQLCGALLARSKTGRIPHCATERPTGAVHLSTTTLLTAETTLQHLRA
jgi:hypothetical protein